MGVDEAVDALDRALLEDSTVPAGPDTPARRVMLERRRAHLRALRATVKVKLNAERAIRAAERDVLLAGAGPLTTMSQDPLRRDLRTRSPFTLGLLGGLGLILSYVVYLSLDGIRGTLIVIAIAALLTIGLDPSVGWLMRRGLRRGWAVALIFVSLLAVLGGALYAIVPPVVCEVASFVTHHPEPDRQPAGQLHRQESGRQVPPAQRAAEFLVRADHQQRSRRQYRLGRFDRGRYRRRRAGGAGVDVVLPRRVSPGEGRRLPAGAGVPPAAGAGVGRPHPQADGGYLAGATIVAAQAGLVAGLFAAVVGLPFPWAIALGAALLDFVPVIEPVVVGASMALLGFTQSLTIGLVAAAFYVCQHLFEAYWFHPRVMRRQVDISTGAVVVAIVVGGALLGVVGAVLAVPVAATVQLIVREVLVPHQERS